jgi:hypothetical protein
VTDGEALAAQGPNSVSRRRIDNGGHRPGPLRSVGLRACSSALKRSTQRATIFGDAPLLSNTCLGDRRRHLVSTPRRQTVSERTATCPGRRLHSLNKETYDGVVFHPIRFDDHPNAWLAG